MSLNEIIENIPFKNLLSEFVGLYIKEYGEIQWNEISQKVNSSSSANKFLLESNKAKSKPNRDNFMVTIHSIFYFSFARAEKVALGSIILLFKWQKVVAIPNNLEDNRHLNETFFGILEKCKGYKIQISNADNLFTKFDNIVGNKFSKILDIANKIQDEINDPEYNLNLVLKRTFDESLKLFHEQMSIIVYDDDDLDEEEIRKQNKEEFEIVIILLAIMSVAIDRDENINNKYETIFNKFVGAKIGEFSENEVYSEIFFTEEFYLFMEIMDRMRFYKKEIKQTLENKIYSPPLGILYYYLQSPGNYYPENEYTIVEERIIRNFLEKDGLIDDHNITWAIKKIYGIILNHIV